MGGRRVVYDYPGKKWRLVADGFFAFVHLHRLLSRALPARSARILSPSETLGQSASDHSPDDPAESSQCPHNPKKSMETRRTRRFDFCSSRLRNPRGSPNGTSKIPAQASQIKWWWGSGLPS